MEERRGCGREEDQGGVEGRVTKVQAQEAHTRGASPTRAREDQDPCPGAVNALWFEPVPICWRCALSWVSAFMRQDMHGVMIGTLA